jgi:putative hydrolase of HD superfamily
MKPNLQQLFTFVQFLEKFRAIKRTIYLPGTTDMENDVEHSYQLAMVSWYVNSVENLGLDMEKVFMYCLAHDIVEVYAGDTYVHTTDQALLDSKKDREHAAYLRIKKEFSEFPDMVSAIDSYEQKSNPESEFVYAMDKLIPEINIYMDDGRFWQDFKVTHETFLKNKLHKINGHPITKKYQDELSPLIQDKFYKP